MTGFSTNKLIHFCPLPAYKIRASRNVKTNKLHHEKTNNVVSETGPTQTGLYSHRSRLEA